MARPALSIITLARAIAVLSVLLVALSFLRHRVSRFDDQVLFGSVPLPPESPGALSAVEAAKDKQLLEHSREFLSEPRSFQATDALWAVSDKGTGRAKELANQHLYRSLFHLGKHLFLESAYESERELFFRDGELWDLVEPSPFARYSGELLLPIIVAYAEHRNYDEAAWWLDQLQPRLLAARDSPEFQPRIGLSASNAGYLLELLLGDLNALYLHENEGRVILHYLFEIGGRDDRPTFPEPSAELDAVAAGGSPLAPLATYLQAVGQLWADQPLAALPPLEKARRQGASDLLLDLVNHLEGRVLYTALDSQPRHPAGAPVGPHVVNQVELSRLDSQSAKARLREIVVAGTGTPALSRALESYLPEDDA